MRRLSIIVPTLNEAEQIENTLLALQDLRLYGAEVIVVDGGSADDTVALAVPLADKVVRSPRGRAKQMNAGAAVADSEVLLFLHADTLLPDRADRLILVGLAAGNRVWGRFDVRITGKPVMLKVIARLMNWRSRLTGIATGDQAMFMHRDAFATVGGFPEQPLMEDIELSCRLKRLSPPLCLRAHVVTSGRRWGRRGLWNTVLLMWGLRLGYFMGIRAETLAQFYR